MGYENDEGAARELDLYAENESALYGQFKSIIENIKKKIAAGKYNPRRAPKLWGYWYHAAAKRYVHEFGGEVRTQFPAKLRNRLAQERAKDEYIKIRAGEYGQVVKKAKRSKARRHHSPRRSGSHRVALRHHLARRAAHRRSVSRRAVSKPARWSSAYLTEAIQLASDATLEKMQADNRDPEIAKLLRIEFAKRGH